MQQINLFHPSLRKKKDHLSFENIRLVAVLAVVVLVLISAVQGYLHHRVNSELAQLKQEQQQLMLDVQKVTAELSAISDSSALQETLVSKEKELTNKQNVLSALSGRQFGNVKGFAEHFTGLARQHIDGLWLTGLHIHAGGQKLNLQGSTYVPEKVPKYLQNLSAEPSFSGLEFRSFLMEREEKSTRVKFDIRSNRKEQNNG